MIMRLAKAALSAEHHEVLCPILDRSVDVIEKRHERVSLFGASTGRLDYPGPIDRSFNEHELVEHGDLAFSQPALASSLAVVKDDVSVAMLGFRKWNRNQPHATRIESVSEDDLRLVIRRDADASGSKVHLERPISGWNLDAISSPSRTCA